MNYGCGKYPYSCGLYGKYPYVKYPYSKSGFCKWPGWCTNPFGGWSSYWAV